MYGKYVNKSDDRIWLDRCPPTACSDASEYIPYRLESREEKKKRQRLELIKGERLEAWSDLVNCGINTRALKAIGKLFFNRKPQQFHQGRSYRTQIRHNLLSCIGLVYDDATVPFSLDEFRRANKAVTSDIDNIWGGRPLVNRYDWRGIARSLIQYPGASYPDVNYVVNNHVYKLAWRLASKTAPLAENPHQRADSLEVFFIYCHYEAAVRVENFFYEHPELVHSTLGVSCLVCPYYIDTQCNWQLNTGISEKAWYAAKKDFHHLIKERASRYDAHNQLFHRKKIAPPLIRDDEKLLRAIRSGSGDNADNNEYVFPGEGGFSLCCGD